MFRPVADEVHVSCVFTWDRLEAERLQRSWSRFYPKALVGGPAYDDPGGEFVPGRYVGTGVVVTSRGCPRRCSWCYVPKREGRLRLLKIRPGNNIIDNNILACSRSHVEAVFEMLEGQHAIRFSGGLDSRLLKQWHVDWFEVNRRRIKFLFFAADDDAGVERIEKIAGMLDGLDREKKRCFVLMGYGNDTPDDARARAVRVWKAGLMPFAQFFRGKGEQPKTPEWAALQRTWSRPAAMKAEMKK